MCTYNITVDEAALRKLQPSFSRESFGRWLQRHVDELVEDMTTEQHTDSPIAHTEDEMKAIVEERLQQLDAGETTLISGEQVFAQIRSRYGFKG
ncbi:MAG: addiction module protein [Bacteroidales bacterium]|nr:addiction module protein [Bacteroidales bacterium]